MSIAAAATGTWAAWPWPLCGLGRGMELLVEHAAELVRGHRLVREAHVAPGCSAQEVQLGLAGQDDAGDGVVEQSADSANGLGASSAVLQPVIGNDDVWSAAPLPNSGHGLVCVDSGEHLIAPCRQERL